AQPGNEVGRRHVRREDQREVRTQYRYGIGQHRQGREHHQRSQQTRERQVCHGVIGQRLQCVYLLGHAHGAYFSRHSCANAAGEHETREKRTKFQHDALPRNEAYHGQLYAAEELVAGLECRNAAQKCGHDDHEGKGANTYRAHLADGLPSPGGRICKPSYEIACEVSSASGVAHYFQRTASHPAEQALHDAPVARRGGTPRGVRRCRQVRTPHMSTRPTTPNRSPGIHAAGSGIITPRAPRARVSWMRRRKRMVVPRLTPIPYAAPPRCELVARGAPNSAMIMQVTGIASFSIRPTRNLSALPPDRSSVAM